MLNLQVWFQIPGVVFYDFVPVEVEEHDDDDGVDGVDGVSEWPPLLLLCRLFFGCCVAVAAVLAAMTSSCGCWAVPDVLALPRFLTTRNFCEEL